jgi:hypothetical protein
MIDAARLPRRTHFVIAILSSVALGASLGATLALAQVRPTGQLDLDCANRCTAHGYDTEFCGKVCWLPDPTIAAQAVPIDWICMTDCLDRGGKFTDCKLRCRRQ